MSPRGLLRLRRDRRGIAMVEFAFVAPVMIIVLMGLGEVLYQPYVQSVLTGAVQKAGRDSTIEDSVFNEEAITAIDDRVKAAVRGVAKDATFTSNRESYSSFALIKPEYFVDANGNKSRDNNECFDDVNGNGKWDANPGRVGQGGADDITAYTMTVTYPRLFPVTKVLGWSSTQTLSAKTILKNQPYKAQTNHEIKKLGTCS